MIDKNEELFYSIPKYSDKTGDKEIKTLIDLLDHVFPLFLSTFDNKTKEPETPNSITIHKEPWVYQSKTYCALPKLSFTEGDTSHEIKDCKPPLEKNIIPITKSFLQELAYGIQSIKNFHPTRTLLMISKRISHIKNAAHQKNHSVILASDYFLEQLKNSLKWFSQIPKTVLRPNNENPNLIFLSNHFKEILTSKKKQRPKLVYALSKAIANDIYLLNSLSFLSLKIPVEHNHQLTMDFNRLIDLFTSDFKTTLDNYHFFQIKFQVYLKAASHLLELKDYHGAGILHVVFGSIESELIKIKNEPLRDKYEQLIKNEELIKLHSLYSPYNNFSILREVMRQNLGVPFFPVVCKDLLFTADGNNFSDQIEIFGKIYLDLSRNKIAVNDLRKTMNFEFQTNLSNLIANNPIIENSPSPRANNSDTPKDTLTTSQKSKKTFSKKEKREKRYSIPVKIEACEKENTSIDAAEPKRRTTIQTLSHTLSRFFLESPRYEQEDSTIEDDTPKMSLTFTAEI